MNDDVKTKSQFPKTKGTTRSSTLVYFWDYLIDIPENWLVHEPTVEGLAKFDVTLVVATKLDELAVEATAAVHMFDVSGRSNAVLRPTHYFSQFLSNHLLLKQVRKEDAYLQRPSTAIIRASVYKGLQCIVVWEFVSSSSYRLRLHVGGASCIARVDVWVGRGRQLRANKQAYRLNRWFCI